MLKKILIISPHFPPSNLAAVHRSRLFAQHLPQYGWEPIVLAVHEDYYEEQLDPHLAKLLPSHLRVEKVTAFPVTKPRLVGDIGLRGFWQLYRRAKALIEAESIDFLYIPIPSFYVALLGRWLHATTGIRYGIDYIDPWVHVFAGSNRIFSRHWLSTRVANWLEPIAVKRASLITGVAAGYYKGVQERNPHLLQQAVFGAMPYGGEASDHHGLAALDIAPYLFAPTPGVLQLVYAGAMLPKAYAPLEALFKALAANPAIAKQIQLHFIGTGKRANDAASYNIKPLAIQYGLWETTVYEYPKRISYVDVLVHLNAADGIFILGSTEPHYTPSKTYQGVLSGKPILAVLHQASTAVQVLQTSGAGKVLSFDGETDMATIENHFVAALSEFMDWTQTFNTANIDQRAFDEYSARAITGQLAQLLDCVQDKP